MRSMILSGAVTPSSLVLYLFGPLFSYLKNEIISSLPLIRLFLRWMACSTVQLVNISPSLCVMEIVDEWTWDCFPIQYLFHSNIHYGLYICSLNEVRTENTESPHTSSHSSITTVNIRTEFLQNVFLLITSYVLISYFCRQQPVYPLNLINRYLIRYNYNNHTEIMTMTQYAIKIESIQYTYFVTQTSINMIQMFQFSYQ